MTFEVDRNGDGNWTELTTIDASEQRQGWVQFDPATEGEWIRVRSSADLSDAVCFFQYQNDDERSAAADPKFAGIAQPSDAQNFLGARLGRADNQRLAVVSQLVADGKVQEERYYELTEDAK